MKIAVMLGGVLLVIVASSWAHGDEPRPGEGLDPTGNPTNLTQLSRISDVNTFLSHKSSIGERAQDLSCESRGGVYVAQQCLIFHDEEAVNWEEAAAKCVSNGAQLASPADPSALIQYKDNKYGDKHFWVGGTDAITQGHWLWLTGKPFGDSFPWSTTPFGDTMEPNNYGGNEHCVMTWNGNGYNDATCIKRLPYICELGSDICWTGSCPTNFERIGNCCYYFSVDNHQDKRNWQGAKDACKVLGGDLFEVGTGGCTGDVNVMRRISDTRVHTWSGANSLDGGATWQWARTGVPVPHNSNMWWHGDPRTENKNCMHAFTESWTTERAYFGIAPCDTQMNHFVCQLFG